MPSKTLIDSIKSQLSSGKTPDEIRTWAEAAGWPKPMVNETLALITGVREREPGEKAVSLKKKSFLVTIIRFWFGLSALVLIFRLISSMSIVPILHYSLLKSGGDIMLPFEFLKYNGWFYPTIITLNFVQAYLAIWVYLKLPARTQSVWVRALLSVFIIIGLAVAANYVAGLYLGPLQDLTTITNLDQYLGSFNLSQFIQYLPIVPVIVIGLLLVAKGNFSQPSTMPTKNYSLFFLLFFFLFAIVPATYFGWGFYQAYFPDYKYDFIASEVTFHVYQPSYLPPGFTQKTTFHQVEEGGLFPGLPSVRVVYSTGMDNTLGETNRPMIVITQSQVPPRFDFDAFLLDKVATTPSSPQISPVDLSDFPNTRSTFNQSLASSTIYIQTLDDVLIAITSTSNNTPLEELSTVGNSLY